MATTECNGRCELCDGTMECNEVMLTTTMREAILAVVKSLGEGYQR